MIRKAQVVLWLAAVVVGMLAASSAGQGPPGGVPPGLDEAIAAKQKHADTMLDKPGVAGIAVVLNQAGKPVIRIYKEKDDVSGLPDELDGVAVESVTTGVIEPYDHLPTHRYPRPVPIGVSAGLAGVATGTLGVRVTNGTNTYALSNNHVLAGVNTASIGDPIISPGDVDGGSDPGDRIGTLAAYQEIDFNGGTNTMDAAIALTSTANVGTATPANGYGEPSPITATASLGLPVQKYGRTTGLQFGSVAGTNVSVDVCYIAFGDFCLQEARFAGQLSVSPGPFSAPGDSGSLIVTQGSNQPVALLFAGGEGLTIASPIDLVLQRFGVTIEGTPPGDGPPTAPSSLQAIAGDAQVALSWNAPAFDGGSQISEYKVYRGTSSGGESLLPTSTITSTSYIDTTAANGTTYYYEVAAVNGNGVGPTSNEAVATPVAAVAPSSPLAIVDNFNRANENPLSDAGRWTNSVIPGESGHHVTSNQLACSVTTTCTAWRNAQYGPDVEVYARVPTLPGDNNVIRLYARLQQPAHTGYMLRTLHKSGADEVWLERFAGGATRLLTIVQELTAGDILLLRVQGASIEAWRHDGSSWSRLGVAQDATYIAAGSAGVGLRGTTGRLDDFGARTIGASSPPGVPTALSAFAGDAQVALSWNAPAFDGGSQISEYKVYRGTSSGGESLLPTSTITSTSYIDTTAANGTTYYYEVAAVNGNGVGPTSNEAVATPVAAVAPSSPLAIVDNFNRANENPLSDAGRWTNSVIPGESGHHVTSNQLACSVTTTCTAWRNAQYGPDVEVYARVPTLPGDNNVIRLYARLQQPAHTGYMLRTLHKSGADEVWLERFAGGATRLLTIVQELTAGDILLLRVQGASIEAWRHDGSSWSRLGVAQDATYIAAGSAGVGLRGTTGRLDDFGARTIGTPPPDTEPPSAPGTLTASAASPSQINLSWGAATDNGTLGLYRIERCQGESCANFVEVATTANLSYQDGSLSPSTPYSYRVRAQDTATPPNVGGFGNTASATTLAPPDTEPPSAPGTLTASAASPSQINLSWGAATDNGTLGLYRIERCQGESCANFVEVATTANLTYQDGSLSPSTPYSYRVRAQDTATPPNVGGFGNTASATTLAPPDTEPPSAPGTLTASAASPSQINLSWGAATDNGTLGLYRIERCQGESCANFVEVATTANLTYQDGSLSPSTPYSYRVRAQDTATPPNVGGFGNTASATTLAPPDTEPPSAPGTLTASAASPSQINLSWGAATDNGTLGLYRIERCQGESCANFVEVATTANLSYQDGSLSPSTPYSYRVRAQDTATPPNVGGFGNTASATTPSGIVTPAEPLPTIDSFNRGNENPLRDGGRWSNGVSGSAETGLRLRSNAIECTKTTTCTAWRNNATYGPDTEVWARVATLAGTNNHFRLYARLQGAGTSAHTGYMLRTNQLAGTDQVLLERLDGATLVNRLTISQELAVGDTLLLRVNGLKLEAWLKRGSAWSLLGSVVDSTYTAAGRVGVGIRGKSGRLDDFGAR